MTTYNISITVTGHDKASGPLNSVKGSLGGLGSIVGGILTAGGLVAIGQQIVQLGRDALSSYADFERLGMSLQSLVARELVNTGQAESMAGALGMAGGRAEELLGWVQKLAIQSPFTQQGIAESFQQALAYGFTTAEAQRLTQAMVDYAAGSGKSAAVMDRISLALGQIRARGTLAGQEINQLTEAGIPVREILAKAFNVTTAELIEMQEKGLIPADKAIEAITKSLEEDFGGAAKRQAGTFAGLVSSLEDIKSVGLRTFFEGTFKSVQPYLQKFVDKFSDPLFMQSLSNAGERLGDFVAIALDGFSKLQDDIQLLRARFELFSQTPAFRKIMDSFRSIFDAVTQPQVLEGARKIFDGISNFLMDLSEKVVPFAMEVINKIGAWFEENGPLIGRYVGEVADRFTNYFLPALLLVWDVAEPILLGILDLVLGLVEMTMQLFLGDWKGAWNTFLKIVTNAGKALWKSLTVLLDGIAKIMGSSGNEIKKVWSDNWKQLQEIVSKVLDLIAKFVKDKLSQIHSWIRSKLNEIQTAWDSAWNAVRNATNSVLSGILGSINSIMNTIRSTVSSAISSIRSVWDSGWSAIRTLVSNALNAIVSNVTSRVSSILTAFSGVVPALGTIFSVSRFLQFGSNIVDGIRSGIANAWNGLVSYVSGLLASLLGAINSAIGGALSGSSGAGSSVGGDDPFGGGSGGDTYGGASGGGTGPRMRARAGGNGNTIQNFYAPITINTPSNSANSSFEILKSLQGKSA